MGSATAAKVKGPRTILKEGDAPVTFIPAPPVVVPPPRRAAEPASGLGCAADHPELKGRYNSNKNLRIRVTATTKRRLAVVAEYERVRTGDVGKGKYMSVLALHWILAGLDAAEMRMEQELAAIAYADRMGFAGSPPGGK